MITVTIIIACSMLGGALLLNFFRLLRGPLLADRILALDTLYITAIALLLLLDMHWQQTLYFEAALLIAVFGFISTVALAKFRTRGAVIE
jgi:multicomponent K+:H+ antiporter subunit F